MKDRHLDSRDNSAWAGVADKTDQPDASRACNRSHRLSRTIDQVREKPARKLTAHARRAVDEAEEPGSAARQFSPAI